MGRRGPVPQPAHLKRAKGNPGKRPITEPPKPEAGDTTCPDWLSDQARFEWERLAPQLRAVGLLTALDVDAFSVYCETLAAWTECQRVINEQGPLYVTPKGTIRPRPEVELAKIYGSTVKAYGAEFGLSPASRARLYVEVAVKEEDEFERWLRSGPGNRA